MKEQAPSKSQLLRPVCCARDQASAVAFGCLKRPKVSVLQCVAVCCNVLHDSECSKHIVALALSLRCAGDQASAVGFGW